LGLFGQETLIKTLLQPKNPNFKQVMGMLEPIRKRKALRAFLILTLLVSSVAVGSFAAYALQSMRIPLEVKEPLEVVDYPSGFSLYPGETINFEITVKNLATINYFIKLDFRLNDTEYQAKYVTFSNHNYSIPPGTQKLSAWLTVAPTATPATLMITINRKTDTLLPSPSPEPATFNSNTLLTPSLKLLGGGARWAARNGTKALYINEKDNWVAHHLTDGADWDGWLPESVMDTWRSSISSTLEQAGFEVTFAGDIPQSLNTYDVIVIEAYWAVEPKHASMVEEYLANGGGVVILRGAPCYFNVYCKNRWPGEIGADLTPIQEWFGSSAYINIHGNSRLTVDKPFGIDLAYNDIVYEGLTGSEKGVTSLNSNAQTIALWEWGSSYVFAFIHEYGKGRLYYQGGTVPVPY
jgi:hypothetical protein